MTKCVQTPHEKWAPLLDENLKRAESIARVLGPEKILSARKALIEETDAFEARLSQVAKKVDIDWKVQSVPFGRPIVMSGHQPVIYHPGLLQKVIDLEAFKPTMPVCRINIILDTDEVSAGQLRFPAASSDGPKLAVTDISAGGSLLMNQVVEFAGNLQTIKSDVLARIDRSSISEAVVRSYGSALDLYGALHGNSISDVQSIVRRTLSKSGYAEVTLSSLLKRPEIQHFVLLPLASIGKFVGEYNGALDEHRASRKIDNPANPFPNLVVEGDSFEAPLWLIDIKAGTRAKLFVTENATNVTVSAGKQVIATLGRAEVHTLADVIGPNYLIAPRGGWISALFRTVLCDLFIHGLGGGKYDEFTNQFLFRWLGTSAPDFVVSSCTRYLFPEQVDTYTKSVELKAKFKDLISHTENYLGKGIFGERAEGKLAPMAERRKDLLSTLRSQQTSGSEVKYELNALNKEIRSTIEASELPNLLKVAETPEAVVSAWMSREYPFFVFT